MSDPLDKLTLSQIADEARAVVSNSFPNGGAPEGLLLSIVRAMRQAETRGFQACLDHFKICDDCSPLQ